MRKQADRKLGAPFVWVAGLAALLLAACGGGGDSPTATPTTPPPARIEPTPVAAVPVATYPDVTRLAAFARLNELRAAAKVGLLAQNTQLDVAAQAHSSYQAANNVQSHNEVAGMPGFTGTTPWARAPVAGYDANALNEVINFDATLSGAGQIDALMSAPYHRMPLLSYSYLDVGIGNAAWPSSTFTSALTIDIGRRGGLMQGAPGMPIAVWPIEGATGLPTTMTPETPNPIPENNGAPAGYTISAQVNESWRTLAVSSFTLYDATGAVVLTKLLTAFTDSFLANFAGGSSYVALLPRAPLARNATYTVTFAGTTALQNAGNTPPVTPVNKTWSFSTGSR